MKKQLIQGSCRTCLNAQLIRYGSDPLIALCKIRNERFVANTTRICKDFRLNEENEQKK